MKTNGLIKQSSIKMQKYKRIYDRYGNLHQGGKSHLLINDGVESYFTLYVKINFRMLKYFKVKK